MQPTLVTAQLADAHDNPVLTSGKTVSWSSTGAGGSFATPFSITDANGQAVIAFKVNTLAGTVHTVTASDNTALTGTTGTGITVIAASLDHFVGFFTGGTGRDPGAKLRAVPGTHSRPCVSNTVG